MSVIWALMIVIIMLIALTLLAVSHAFVELDTVEMELHALVNPSNHLQLIFDRNNNIIFIDTDECFLNMSDCNLTTMTCINTNGSFTCIGHTPPPSPSLPPSLPFPL